MALNERPEYALRPVGFVSSEGDTPIIKLMEDYGKALLNLDQFSHGLVFYFHSGALAVDAVELIQISEERGEVGIGGFRGSDGAAVYDIKPYFANEDRIAEAKTGGESGRLHSISHYDETNHMAALKPNGSFILQRGLQFLDLDELPSGIEPDTYYRVIWWFHRFDKKHFRRSRTCTPPYENAPETGIFATRSPVRPNPIASSVVKVLSVDDKEGRIGICGFDGFDHSVIIDLIPYEPLRENIGDSRRPVWLRHWPDRKRFGNPKPIADEPLLEPGDIYRLGQLSQISEPAPEEVGGRGKEAELFDSTRIIVKNASQNNLDHVDAAIPKNRITVVTGLSGSGKSSFAFDTVFAESQRQFTEIMGADRNRSFEKPAVESITGLQPAIAIEQKSVTRNPRSTVGTMTGIADYLRTLFVTIGTRHCPDCRNAVERLSEAEIILLLSRIRPGERVLLDHKSFEDRSTNSDERILSCLSGSSGYISFIEKNVPSILNSSGGRIYIKIGDDKEFKLQTKAYCFHCDRVFFDLTASVFSFNNPDHMCPRCKGLGEELSVDEFKVIHDRDKSILDGASKLWGDLRKHARKPNANWMRGEVLALAYDMGVDLELPYRELPERFREQLLYGSGDRKVRLEYETKGRKGVIERPAEGVMNIVERLISNNASGSTAMAGMVNDFLKRTRCGLCAGERLGEEGRLVEILGVRYPVAASMKVDELRDWLNDLYHFLPPRDLEKAKPLLRTMLPLIDKVIQVGLSYLDLDRSVPSLSGGEGQRLRLASQFGTNLTNILYVLDEPSKGLHPHDYQFLKAKLMELRDRDNTILMVEHKREMIEMADHIIDMGPGAGRYGGKIIAEGDIEAIRQNGNSLTGAFLSAAGEEQNPFESPLAGIPSKGVLTLFGAAENNLKDLRVEFPLGKYICVTGVSGSGKSSLVSRTLCPAINRALGKTVGYEGVYDKLTGAESIKDLIEVTQSPIGKTPRSNPATYSGVFDLIRDLFASLEDSRRRKLGREHFSFNGSKGQCPICKGAGQIQTSLNFIPDFWTVCHGCEGKRYRSPVLEVLYRGSSIADVLELEIDDAAKLFADVPDVRGILETMCDVGLGYLKLGQSATTLSGGEAQRLKLARELGKSRSKDTVYVFDEPSTGLHHEDIRKLVEILFRLREQGNTVIVIEHDPGFIRYADHIIDLGPEGGEGGGFLVAAGTPAEIAAEKESMTGRLLLQQPDE